MSKQVFNPDDFVFEQFKAPEEKKPILEYDAINRIILIRTKTSEGEYTYNSAFLSIPLNKSLLKNISDEWSNDNDRIVLFAIYEDGEYFLYKEKLKFDFATKETKWIRYEYKDLSVAQAKELFEIIKAAVYAQQLDKQIEKSNNILELANKDYYLKQKSLQREEERDKLLRESDWTILEDAPQTFEGEKELWIVWRNKLRDIVKTPENFEDALDYLIYDEEFKWPIDPLIYHNNYPDHNVEYLSTEDQFVKSHFASYNSPETILGESIRLAALRAKELQENGVSVDTQLYKLIEKYKLTDALENVDITNLTVGE